MSNITLRKENVVKVVGSEEAAKMLEKKGFVRDGAIPVGTQGASSSEIAELKEQLQRASIAVMDADEKRGEVEKELTDTKAKLEEADQKIESLNQNLSRKNEQLEAANQKIVDLTQELIEAKEQSETAVKKNAAKKEK